MHSVGLFCEHPLQGILHAEPSTTVKHKCPKCPKTFSGKVKQILEDYREHVYNTHSKLLAACKALLKAYAPNADFSKPSELHSAVLLAGQAIADVNRYNAS